MSSERYEILPGLPATGPPALAIKAGKEAAWSGHSEGFVVRFLSRAGGDWVGNFQTHGAGWSGCVDHPDGRHVIVVAGGCGYLVDPERPGFAEALHQPIEHAVAVPELKAVVVFDGMRFEAWTRDGIWWQSEPIGWGSVCDIEHDGDRLQGAMLVDASDEKGEVWQPFSLDLRTGKLTSSEG